MNILIVTPFYKQDRNIASVRWTNFAKRLAKNHKVFVVSQPQDDMDMNFSVVEEEGIIVARCNQKTAYEKVAVRYFGGETGDDWQTKSDAKSCDKTDVEVQEGIARKLKNAILYGSMQQKAKQYASFVSKKVVPADIKIHVVISSALPFIEMLFGYELKKKFNCKWVCDFRDLPYYYDTTDGTHRMKKILQHALAHAEAITVVLDEMKRFLINETIADEKKIYTITNGFSLADARVPVTNDDKTLRIVHTGSLYSGKRRADFLFRAIAELKKEKQDCHIVLECAGGGNATLLRTAEKYGLRDCVIDHGFVPRDEALNLQNSADCLLLLVENLPGGALSGKIFEYLLCEKPIISISCGDIPRCAVTAFVHKLNLGCAIEEPDGEMAVKTLFKYLEMQVERKCSGQPLEFNPDKEGIKQYDHDNIVKRIEEICFDITK